MLISAQRLGALIGKELKQIIRDPSSVLIAFVMPIVLLVVNGFGISLDAREARLGVVIEASGPEPLGLFTAMTASPYLKPRAYLTSAEAEADLMAGNILAILVLREDFAAALARDAAPVPLQLIVDGVDANTARIVTGYVEGAAALWYGARAGERGLRTDPRIRIEHRYWFNPEVRSTNFLVPGLVPLIMTLIGALLTALIVAREWERGTMEAMMATPASSLELLLSKLIAYFGLGIGGMIITLIASRLIFEVPFRGSFAALLLVSAVFLLGALMLGLVISTGARNQFVAAQIAFNVTYMPALMLSGFLFDVHSMPWAVQRITDIVAAKYFVSALQTLFLAGDVWPIILPNVGALALFAVVFFLWARLRSRRRLD
jgi:ABC-2 type transport system permease protein